MENSSTETAPGAQLACPREEWAWMAVALALAADDLAAGRGGVVTPALLRAASRLLQEGEQL
ncbi:MAG: hypothetical protein KGL63_13630 [Betaproteobacteria bacterium]|nr:hypothetical protein [Betaproteobacteria bacterium]